MVTENIMKTIQPYFVMATPKYHKGIVMNYGILHFYDYYKNTELENRVMVVPDGCIDIMFEKDASGIKARVAGTVLEKTMVENKNGKEYFGVRFLAGELPAIVNADMKDFVQNEINLEDVMQDKDFLKRMEEAYDQGKWMEGFLKLYKEAFDKDTSSMKRGNTGQLVKYMKNQIISTNGNIAVSELAEQTGYTERYINKVFKQSMGINPKTFGMIMKFQKVIQKINREEGCKLTDIGADVGYYDQSHFIRDFKKFAALTPKEYRKMILENAYNRRLSVKKVQE